MEDKQKRMKKTSSEQFHYMINFLGEHKIMLKGKLSPAESTKVGQLWIQLTKELNNLNGSVKTLQQWKRTFIEYKSKVKSKSRVIQNKLKGTGGGPAEAQLNETENLCLNLIGRITTEGDPEIEEVGLTNEGPTTSSDCELITVVGDSIASNASKFEEVADAGLIDMENITDTCSTLIPKEVPVQNYVCTPTSKKSKKTTTTTTPKASTLKELADTNEKICQSLSSISSAISTISKSNDAIAASNSVLAASNNNLASSINLLANAIQLLAQSKT